MSNDRRTPAPESATKGRPCRYVAHHKARAEERRLIRQELEAFSADIREDAKELEEMLRDEGLDDDWDYDWDYGDPYDLVRDILEDDDSGGGTGDDWLMRPVRAGDDA
jgi:hypothetical protein